MIFSMKYTNSGAVRFDPAGNGRVGMRSHSLNAKKSILIYFLMRLGVQKMCHLVMIYLLGRKAMVDTDIVPAAAAAAAGP